MALRFRKIIRIFSWFKINISKTGLSVSLGKRGAALNMGKRGPVATVGIPGTGISYSANLKSLTSSPFFCAVFHFLKRHKIKILLICLAAAVCLFIYARMTGTP